MPAEAKVSGWLARSAATHCAAVENGELGGTTSASGTTPAKRDRLQILQWIVADVFHEIWIDGDFGRLPTVSV